MRIRLQRGRLLGEFDRANSPSVAVINGTMARRYWPAQNPVGHRLRVGDGGPLVEIVGEVSDTKFSSSCMTTQNQSSMCPIARSRGDMMSLVIRTPLDAASIGPAVSRIVHRLDADSAISAPKRLPDLVATSMATERLETLGMTAFAMLTLLLASIGLYGVTAYLATQRTREVGIRIALGASRAMVVRQFVMESVQPLVPGVIGGGGLALIVSRLLQSQLFAVTSSVSFALLGLGMAVSVAVAIAATAVPAWRASRVDPAIALRAH